MGGERTFGENISAPDDLREQIDRIVDTVWDRIESAQARGRTVTLKLRFADFRTITRARSVTGWVADKALFAAIGHDLLAEQMPLPQPVRLMGLTLSGLERASATPDNDDEAQLPLL